MEFRIEWQIRDPETSKIRVKDENLSKFVVQPNLYLISFL